MIVLLPGMTRAEFIQTHKEAGTIREGDDCDVVPCNCDYPEVCTGWKIVFYDREAADVGK